jgi:hypothetical protein
MKDYIKEYKDFVSNNDKLQQDGTGHGTTALRLLLKLYDDAEVYVGRVFEHKDADDETERLMAEVSHIVASKYFGVLANNVPASTGHNSCKEGVESRHHMPPFRLQPRSPLEPALSHPII